MAGLVEKEGMRQKTLVKFQLNVNLDRVIFIHWNILIAVNQPQFA
jgi:hypothetical protein